ncbi:LysR family transcriptional regulator [Alteromonas halophila]|uniref:Transcriptional activator NhaR n=1 Tax=Alteromonas halophila TaxID=516698 RepID=A0A918JJ73_9ALTE|nr:LysR family transcriptional regulator [Alteromonas halophila]GGW82188.1 transcriptional activator NhaR [Alteromonas halophila]
MSPVNYHHLYYFYVVAREGSIASAASVIHVTAQTISGQLATFESNIGYPLFDRVGKRLHLNSRGKRVYQHAEVIFEKGRELAKVLRDNDDVPASEFVIGVTDAIPKVLAFDFLDNVIRSSPDTRFIFREGSFDSLVSDIAINRVDLVLADHGLPPGSNVNATSLFLGESELSFFAAKRTPLDDTVPFPACLHNAPLLLPGSKSGIVQALKAWLDSHGIYPHIVAEFDDSALLKLFGREGFGVFCAPSSISAHVESQYGVACIGEAREVTERYFALCGRSMQNTPLLQRIVSQAKALLQ